VDEPVAIISDIHANLEALEAVLADIDSQGIGRVLCLGDVVGYGVDAPACIALVERWCEVCLCGNHDWAIFNSTVGFNPVARHAIEVTRRQLAPGRLSLPGRRRRWEFLRNLPHTHTVGEWLLVHGSPRGPVAEYIFPEDMDRDPEKMSEIFSMVPRLCFVGHTHLPGVFVEGMGFWSPVEIGGRFVVSDAKAVVNVGSVGQPRDEDPRACYVVVAEGVVRYRRVAYDAQRTAEKIRASRIENLCGDRLLEGR